MDYRKIIIYLVIILIGVGVWYKIKNDEKQFQQSTDMFITVYSSLSVLAEIYRNEPARYNQVRDSVCTLYGFNEDSLLAFQERLRGTEGEWPMIWSRVRGLTDSLIEYYKENPVEHPVPDTTDTLVTESTDSL